MINFTEKDTSSKFKYFSNNPEISNSQENYLRICKFPKTIKAFPSSLLILKHSTLWFIKVEKGKKMVVKSWYQLLSASKQKKYFAIKGFNISLKTYKLLHIRRPTLKLLLSWGDLLKFSTSKVKHSHSCTV